MNTILKYQRIIDKLPTAIKTAILSFILIFIFTVWYYGLWENLSASITTGSNEIKILNRSLPTLRIQLQAVEKEIKFKQTQKNKDQSSGSKLSSPHQTGEILYNLISTSDNLNLIQLKNLPPKTVILSQSNLKIFEHGIMVKFQGDYFSTIQYLKSIEKLKWKIFWDRLEYKVTQYPAAEISLYIHTISDHED